MIEHVPNLVNKVYFRGRLEETDLDDALLPEDETGVRRNELGVFNRERAQWYNHAAECERRRAIKEEATREIEEKKQKKQAAADAKEAEAKDRAERKAKREEAAKKKQEDKKVHDARVSSIRQLREQQAFCYCKKKHDNSVVMMQCEGKMKCPLRGWVHMRCAKSNGDTVHASMLKDEGEKFWCGFCLTHFKQ